AYPSCDVQKASEIIAAECFDQLIAVGEVVIERGPNAAGPLGDVGHPDLLIAQLPEEVPAGAHDLATGSLAICALSDHRRHAAGGYSRRGPTGKGHPIRAPVSGPLDI